MKVLIINKFLKPKGGSETYIIKIGDCLKQKGHQVQYFGMDEPGRTLGNRVNQYTASLDFHTTGFKRFLYPFKIIYSSGGMHRSYLFRGSQGKAYAGPGGFPAGCGAYQ